MQDVRNTDKFATQKNDFADGYLSQEYKPDPKYITWTHFGSHLKHREGLPWTSALELFERVWNTVEGMNICKFGVSDPWVKDKQKDIYQLRRREDVEGE